MNDQNGRARAGAETASGDRVGSVRESAIGLLALLDSETWRQAANSVEHREMAAGALEGRAKILREALRAERSAAFEVPNAALVVEGVARIKAGEMVQPEYIRAIVEAGSLAVEICAGFEMRRQADERAIRMWQAADQGKRRLIWPDHADLVVWLLDALEFKPVLPPVGEVETLVNTLDTMETTGTGRVTPLRRHAATVIRQLAETVITQGRAMFALEQQHALMGDMIVRYEDERRARGPVVAAVGVCRVCGCTETTPCNLGKSNEAADWRSCGWADLAHTLCDNPACCARAGADGVAEIGKRHGIEPSSAAFVRKPPCEGLEVVDEETVGGRFPGDHRLPWAKPEVFEILDRPLPDALFGKQESSPTRPSE